MAIQMLDFTFAQTLVDNVVYTVVPLILVVKSMIVLNKHTQQKFISGIYFSTIKWRKLHFLENNLEISHVFRENSKTQRNTNHTL